MSDEPDDSTIYKVVVNHEEQYSIWPASRANPNGWRDAGKRRRTTNPPRSRSRGVRIASTSGSTGSGTGVSVGSGVGRQLMVPQHRHLRR